MSEPTMQEAYRAQVQRGVVMAQIHGEAFRRGEAPQDVSGPDDVMVLEWLAAERIAEGHGGGHG
ncbi:MAG: hypothetical protein JHC55_00710 [Mycolicibacterium sp.]|nr:hypothetical protein [Mycolicibacterium sp.]